MKPKLQNATRILKELKEDNLYRSLRYGKISGAHIKFGSKVLINFCSNDYLGLKQPKVPIKQMQSSSRLVSGNDPSFERLEGVLAEHKSQEGALVFPTGYMANLGAITALVGKNDLILSDELNHASIIEACRLCNAKTLVYNHNDIDDLEKKIRSNKNQRKFIVTEGVFSMDGDFAPLDKISQITNRHNAVLILDDAHGDFTVGQDGKGTANHFGVDKGVGVYISSLSKGLGSFGGYIATEEPGIEVCVNRARSFIYTSALPSFLIDSSLKRFSQNRELRRKKLQKNTDMMHSGLKNIGYDIKSSSHIIPILVGSEKKALEFGSFLFKNGIFAQPIRYPTVAKKSARIRISMTAWISGMQIQRALDVFEKAGKKFKIL